MEAGAASTSSSSDGSGSSSALISIGSSSAFGSTPSKVTESMIEIIFCPICEVSVRVPSLTSPKVRYSTMVLTTGMFPSCVATVISLPRARPESFSNQSTADCSPFLALSFQQATPPKSPSPTVSIVSQYLINSRSLKNELSRASMSFSVPSRSRGPPEGSIDHAVVPSKPVRTVPNPGSSISVSIMFGAMLRAIIGPLIPAPGISIEPLISTDLSFVQLSLPPMATMDFSRMSFASGSAALGAATGGTVGDAAGAGCAVPCAIRALERKRLAKSPAARRAERRVKIVCMVKLVIFRAIDQMFMLTGLTVDVCLRVRGRSVRIRHRIVRHRCWNRSCVEGCRCILRISCCNRASRDPCLCGIDRWIIAGKERGSRWSHRFIGYDTAPLKAHAL